MAAILYLVVYVYIFFCLFLMYASVMNAGWAKLSLLLKILLAPVGVVFLLIDVAFNISAGTVLFLQWPTRTTLTLSKRMAQNIAIGTGWRKTLSSLIVDNLLLPFTADY